MSKAHFRTIRTHVAAIDIGTTQLHVTTEGETVHVFATFTESIIELIKFLKTERVQSVVLEATGVLWMPLFDMLEEAGIGVCLVNPAHVKNVPAQKTDFLDCRWLYKVFSCGLVRESFVPSETVRELRCYTRMRDDHVESATGKILQMQRACELMNIKLHNVISDLKGKSGLRIMEAIVSGETRPLVLVELCDKQILKKKRDQVIAALQGNYKCEYVFLLRQAYEDYMHFQKQIVACDECAAHVLQEMTKDLPAPPPTKAAPSRHNNPQIEGLHDQLVQLAQGRDAAILPGFCDKSLLKLVGELGTDLSRWGTDKHFSSWATTSPKKHKSGKTNRSKRGASSARVGQIFRECAMGIASSKHLALKGFYYRIKSRRGHKIAIKATARKLAVLYYRFMTNGLDYVENGLRAYEEAYKAKCLRILKKRANILGYDLVPDSALPGTVQ